MFSSTIFKSIKTHVICSVKFKVSSLFYNVFFFLVDILFIILYLILYVYCYDVRLFNKTVSDGQSFVMILFQLFPNPHIISK